MIHQINTQLIQIQYQQKGMKQRQQEKGPEQQNKNQSNTLMKYIVKNNGKVVFINSITLLQKQISSEQRNLLQEVYRSWYMRSYFSKNNLTKKEKIQMASIIQLLNQQGWEALLQTCEGNNENKKNYLDAENGQTEIQQKERIENILSQKKIQLSQEQQLNLTLNKEIDTLRAENLKLKKTSQIIHSPFRQNQEISQKESIQTELYGQISEVLSNLSGNKVQIYGLKELESCIQNLIRQQQSNILTVSQILNNTKLQRQFLISAVQDFTKGSVTSSSLFYKSDEFNKNIMSYFNYLLKRHTSFLVLMKTSKGHIFGALCNSTHENYSCCLISPINRVVCKPAGMKRACESVEIKEYTYLIFGNKELVISLNSVILKKQSNLGDYFKPNRYEVCGQEASEEIQIEELEIHRLTFQ